MKWNLLKSQIFGLFWVFRHPGNKSKFNTLIKVIFWKLNQLFVSYPILVTLYKESKCLCYPNSSYGGMVFLANWPEFYEMNLVASVLEENSNFIDIGANIGVFSLLAASISKKGQIVAFEPNPKALEILNENILINSDNIKNIAVVRKVVSDKNGKELFSLEPTSETSHIVGEESKGRKKFTLEVPSITLGSYVKKRNFSYIDMVKIDVEGAEYKVLRGAKSLLEKGKIGILLMEISNRAKLYGYDYEELLGFLRDSKYSIYKFGKKGKITKVIGRVEIQDLSQNILAVHESKLSAFEKKMKRYLKDKHLD